MRPNKVSVENDKTVSRKMFRRGPFNIICFSTATLDLYTNTNLPVTWRQVRLATHSWRLCDKKMTDFAQEAEYKQLNKQIEGFEKELKQIDPSNPNSQTKKDAKDSLERLKEEGKLPHPDIDRVTLRLALLLLMASIANATRFGCRVLVCLWKTKLFAILHLHCSH